MKKLQANNFIKNLQYTLLLLIQYTKSQKSKQKDNLQYTLLLLIQCLISKKRPYRKYLQYTLLLLILSSYHVLLLKFNIYNTLCYY